MWHISIDTGGTFTDCIAISPNDEVVRAKVLSTSRLRGILTEQISPYRFRFSHRWRIEKDIFQGYSFYLTEILSNFEKWTNLNTSGILVKSIDFQNNIIELTQDLSFIIHHSSFI